MKPLVLGLDLASRSGFAIWETEKHRSSIKAGVLDSIGKNVDPSYRADQIGLKVTAMIRRAREVYGRPFDIVVIEEAMHASLGGISSTINSSMIHGAVYATLSNHGILWGTVNVATWRAGFFGRGFKPPQKRVELKVPDKKGNTFKMENLWKEAAINACDQMGVILPEKKQDQEDAAEAVAIAIRWQDAKVHAARYQDRFKKLLEQQWKVAA